VTDRQTDRLHHHYVPFMGSHTVQCRVMTVSSLECYWWHKMCHVCLSVCHAAVSVATSCLSVCLSVTLLCLLLLVVCLSVCLSVCHAAVSVATCCLSVCLSVAGFLQSADGAVLKPILGRVKGQREVDFYRRLFSEDCDDRALLDLREFVARFLGLWTTPEHPGCE